MERFFFPIIRVHARTAALLFVVALGGTRASAQLCDSPSVSGVVNPRLVMLGSRADERDRERSLLGGCGGSLIRSPLSLSPAASSSSWEPNVIRPTFDLTWNSTIPVTMNDGSMWAGRGLNVMVTGGVRLDRSHLSVIFAPEFTASQNRGFPIVAAEDPARSTYSSPWHYLPVSADLPLRFGSDPFAFIGLGQSSVEARASNVGMGFTTENQWWGPGIRNAIVMSNNAGGIPQLFVRTLHPWKTRLGDLEGRWELGLLTKSRFFDFSEGSGLRSLSAGVITLRTAFDSGLTVGAARAVYAAVKNVAEPAGHGLDVFLKWDQPADVTVTAPPSATTQISSFFFRWVFPEVGFETYAEWARLVPIRSWNDILVRPHDTQGYTLGLQWLNQYQPQRTVRFQAEATKLEQTPPSPGAFVPTFYTSNVARHGYTQRGQVIGAAIGPGGSSQFLGFDFIRPSWRGGVELGRIRWEDESYYRQLTGLLSYRHHDVSLFAGVRGSMVLMGNDLSGGLTFTHRNNFLFQSADIIHYDSAFDMQNVTLRLTVAPRTP
jgi:hypothetical protein